MFELRRFDLFTGRPGNASDRARMSVIHRVIHRTCVIGVIDLEMHQIELG
jgi:hypothetical protein